MGVRRPPPTPTRGRRPCSRIPPHRVLSPTPQITAAYVVSAMREPGAQVEVKPLVQDFVKQLNAGNKAGAAKDGETKKQE